MRELNGGKWSNNISRRKCGEMSLGPWNWEGLNNQNKKIKSNKGKKTLKYLKIMFCMTKTKTEQNRTPISRHKNIHGKIFVIDLSHKVPRN